jgi:hypothetical protein|tara:strand:+ start:472 stop:699 length:228 start_codon:yes stop_codon:yes gene_type:complete
MSKSNSATWLATGLFIGSLVGMGLLHIFETYQSNTTPTEVVCQKGMAYEQTGYGSGVYLKTETECIDTTFIMGEE